MPDKTEINNQFRSLGITVNEDVLDHCESLCNKYHLSEELLVETWVAWSFNQLNGDGPTKEKILEWEQKELSKIKLNSPKVKDTIKVYSSGKIESTPTILSLEKTPESTTKYNGLPSSIGKQSLIFSPASFSPDVYSPSMKYNARADTGHSIISYGSSAKWSASHHKSNIEVKEYSPINIEWKYAYNTLLEESLLMQVAWESLADFLLTKHDLQPPTPFSVNVLENSVFVGRVAAFDKTRSPLKVELQGLFESIGHSVELDVNEVMDYALFPGQVIAVEGHIIANRLLATKIFTSAMLPLPPHPNLADTIQILVAAGPFTLSDTLSYQPLHDLVQFIKENQPNILFLIGPLIDATHSKISDGSIAESFYDYYDRMLTNLIDSLKGLQTKLLIIASNREAGSTPLYPTHPVRTSASLRNVKFYPDPSVLTVGGLVVGLTATDTIFHLGKYEISNSKTNRLGRLGAHMFHQQTFYPLYPCEPDVGLDVTLWDQCARLPITPHILIAPSNLSTFVKNIDGCLLINPGKLAKGTVGGTFACIEVRNAGENEEWSTACNISAKIVKI